MVVAKWRGKSFRLWGWWADTGESLFSEEEPKVVFPAFNCELTEGILAAIVSKQALAFVENLRGSWQFFTNTSHGKLKLDVNILAKGFDTSRVKMCPSKNTHPSHVYPQSEAKAEAALWGNHKQKTNIYSYFLGEVIPKRESGQRFAFWSIPGTQASVWTCPGVTPGRGFHLPGYTSSRRCLGGGMLDAGPLQARQGHLRHPCCWAFCLWHCLSPLS